MFTARLVLSSRLVRFHSVAALANTRPTIGYTAYFRNQQLRKYADKNSFIAEAISSSVADENKELRTADGLTAPIESNEKGVRTDLDMLESSASLPVKDMEDSTMIVAAVMLLCYDVDFDIL